MFTKANVIKELEVKLLDVIQHFATFQANKLSGLRNDSYYGHMALTIAVLRF